MRHFLYPLFLSLLLAGLADAQEVRQDGLGPYRFGMSLSEAQATSPNATWRVEPGPQQTQSLSGGPRVGFGGARFSAALLFDDEDAQLKRIVTFGAARVGCVDSVRALVEELERAYGVFGSAPPVWETADVTQVLRTAAGSELRVHENVEQEGVRVHSTRRGAMFIQVFGEPQLVEGAEGCKLSIMFDPLPPPVVMTSGPSIEDLDRAETLVRPAWIRRPTAQTFAGSYPRNALQRGMGGRAVLDCLVNADGTLHCRLIDEVPTREHFGEAARTIAQDYRVLVDEDGVSAIGKRIRIPIDFRVG